MASEHSVEPTRVSLIRETLNLRRRGRGVDMIRSRADFKDYS